MKKNLVNKALKLTTGIGTSVMFLSQNVFAAEQVTTNGHAGLNTIKILFVLAGFLIATPVTVYIKNKK